VEAFFYLQKKSSKYNKRKQARVKN